MQNRVGCEECRGIGAAKGGRGLSHGELQGLQAGNAKHKGGPAPHGWHAACTPPRHDTEIRSAEGHQPERTAGALLPPSRRLGGGRIAGRGASCRRVTGGGSRVRARRIGAGRRGSVGARGRAGGVVRGLHWVGVEDGSSYHVQGESCCGAPAPWTHADCVISCLQVLLCCAQPGPAVRKLGLWLAAPPGRPAGTAAAGC